MQVTGGQQWAAKVHEFDKKYRGMQALTAPQERDFHFLKRPHSHLFKARTHTHHTHKAVVCVAFGQPLDPTTTTGNGERPPTV